VLQFGLDTIAACDHVCLLG